MRRFYQTAAATDDFGIALDGRPVNTPLKAPLVAPTRALAEAIAAEWQKQGPDIEPADMILTKLANTAIDRVARDRERIVTEIVAYAGSDSVCYRAPEPHELIERQKAAWDPVIAWALAALDAPFAAKSGVVHQYQADAALAAFKTALARETDWQITAIHNLTTLTGSALLALMLARGAIAQKEAWSAAHVDEHWQIEQWGRDIEAEHRRALRNVEFSACVRFMALATIPPAS